MEHRKVIIWSYRINGRPITKKNSMQKTRRGLVQSSAYRDYELSALWQLKRQRKPPEPIIRPVELYVSYYMPNKRSWPDLIGLIQATADILEKARILDNDRLVVQISSQSGIWGIDKTNPRTFINVREITDKDNIAYQLDPYIIKHVKAGDYDLKGTTKE